MEIPSGPEPSPSRKRQIIGMAVAFLGFASIYWFGLFGLEGAARTVAALACGVVVLWTTEALPLEVPAIGAPALAVMLGVTKPSTALASFSHPLIFLFLGGFLLAHALSLHGFDRRAATWIVSRKFVGTSPRRLAIALTLASFLISMWISNTATTAMMLPVAVGVMAAIRSAQTDERARGQVRLLAERTYLGIAFASSMGGMCTPIGTAPNVIALSTIAQYGMHFDFLQWMAFGVPAGLGGLLAIILTLFSRLKSDAITLAASQVALRQQVAKMGKLSPGESRILAVFLLAIVGWLLPAILRLTLGEAHKLTQLANERLNDGIVAISAALLLFIVRAPRRTETGFGPSKPLLEGDAWREIDWSTLYLLGGGMALGKMAFDSGLAKIIGDAAFSGFGTSEQAGVALLVVAVALVVALTEVTSNSAIANMLLPVVTPLALAMGGDPRILILCVTLGASYGFMFPVSTPPNAIVYGTGQIRLPAMIRSGTIIDFFGIFWLVLLGLAWLPQILPALP